MKKISYIKIKDISKCYDKMSKKEISWYIAKRRLDCGLINTFWIVIDSKRILEGKKL